MQKTIFLVDDEEGVRGALEFLLRQHDFDVRGFDSGPALLAALDVLAHPVRGVFLLDIRMEPMDGPTVHDALRARGLAGRCPVLFLSGAADVPTTVAEMRKGALDVLQKPFLDDALVERIQQALTQEEGLFAQHRRTEFLRSLWESLTPRQRDVVLLVSQGSLNKTIAVDLGISERMVEDHRAKAMEKLGVDSPAALATTVADMKARSVV